MHVAHHCPKCGASVPAEERSLTCRYCKASLSAPQAVQHAPAPAAPSKSHALLFAALGVPAVLLGVVALVVLLKHDAAPATSATSATPATPATKASAPATAELPTATATASPPAVASAIALTPMFADFAFEFGEQGKGPGQLDDASQIAVDPNGDVYLSQRNSRRLQHFDPTGKFVEAIELTEGGQDNLVQGLATTYDGHLWVTRGGDLLKLAIPSGKVVKTVPNQKPNVSYQGVAVDATNGLYATNVGANTFISTNGKLPGIDNIRKLDKNGNLLVAWKDVGSKSGASLAVDAEGNLYVAERRSPYIDILDRNGKVKAKFAGAHGMNGQGIVVDGKGRIYTGGRGITVFDGTGSKLGQIGTEEVKCIALGPKKQLYAIIENGPIRVFTLQ